MIKVIAYYEGYTVGHEMLCVDEIAYDRWISFLFQSRNFLVREIVRFG